MVVGSLEIETDVVVIGSGPGGYVAAIRAAQQGLDVMLVEKEKHVGGICLHEGCIPTKAYITSSDYYNALKALDMMGICVENYSVDLEKMIEWKCNIIKKLEQGVQSLLKQNGVEVLEGVARFKSKNQLAISGQSDVETITFKNAIIATGSSTVEIDGFDFSDEHIISSKEALELKEVPENLVIVGGGYIGTELGTVYGKLGSNVHILEGGPHLIPQLDQEIVEVVTKEICKFNVENHYNSKAKFAKNIGDKVEIHFDSDKGDDQVITADKVMVVVGRKPNSKDLGLEEIGVEIDEKGFIKVDNQMKTSVDGILAIGDVVGNPMLAHKATHEGKIAAEVAAGLPTYNDNKVIPLVVFNDPELVSVGLTDKEAEEKGYEYVVKKFPYAALGRAHMFNKTEGFIKMVADAKTNMVLGVHAAGPNVSELVAEATLAIEMGASVEDLSLTIHPHPTISEGITEVADVVLNKGIHIYTPPKKEK